jgi:hypothetical protein
MTDAAGLNFDPDVSGSGLIDRLLDQFEAPTAPSHSYLFHEYNLELSDN